MSEKALSSGTFFKNVPFSEKALCSVTLSEKALSSCAFSEKAVACGTLSEKALSLDEMTLYLV